MPKTKITQVKRILKKLSVITNLLKLSTKAVSHRIKKHLLTEDIRLLFLNALTNRESKMQ